MRISNIIIVLAAVGGYLAGHDLQEWWPGVQEGVEECLGDNWTLEKTSWVHKKESGDATQTYG